MKKRRNLIFGGVAFLLILILTLSMTALAQGNLFSEPFNNLALPGWDRSENVSVQENHLVIEGDGFAFHGGGWADGSYSVRFQRQGQGGMAFHYQVSDDGFYMLHMSGEDIQLLVDQKGQLTELAGSPFEISQGDWHQLAIHTSGQMNTIILDGQVLLEASIPVKLPGGGVLLRIEGELVGLFDDLEVIPSSNQPAEEGSELAESGGSESLVRLPLAELKWNRLGGPPGGLGYDIRYKFDDPDIWYVTDANAGVHISKDNGLTWQQSNNGIDTVGGAAGDSIPVFSLTVDPHDTDIIWIGTDITGNIYRSTDGGANWVQKDKGVIHPNNIVLSFRGFTVDPRSSDIVYAMGELQIPGNNVWGLGVGGVVYKTTDGGENWTRIWDGAIPSSLARYMWIDPRDPDILYVSTGIFDRGAVGETDQTTQADPFGGLGILKSSDGGATWRALGKGNGLEFLYIGSLYMHPDNPDVLFAAAGHMVSELSYQYFNQQKHSPLGIYRTQDGGETWVQVLEPEPEVLVQVFSSVEICPSNPDIMYAGSDTAIYRSDDGGSNWIRTAGGPEGWGPPGVRAGWPIDMQCDPRNTGRVFANNYSGGNFLSEDGGITWKNASTGYSGAQIIGVAVDPFNAARIFAAGRSGIWFSTDAGQSWNGIHNPGQSQALTSGGGGVVLDSTRQDHILLGDQGSFLEWKSESNQWTRTFPPETYFPETSEMEFAPSDANIVYAVAANHNSIIHADNYESGQGIVVSRNGGSNWEDITGSQFSTAVLTDVSIDPTDAGLVYVASQIGLFKTTDGGKNWQEITSLFQGEPVRTVAVNPADPKRILAGVQYKGLFLSQDGGSIWNQISAGLEPNGIQRDIVFDPTDASIVYMGDITSGVYQSTDSGNSWVKISQDLTNRAVTTLSISSNGMHLYAGTSGGGVFRLDLNGLPPVIQQEEAQVTEVPENEIEQTEPAQPLGAETSEPEAKPGICTGSSLLALLVAVFIINNKWRHS